MILKLPQMLISLHEEITSQELKEDHNKILKTDTISLVDKIESLLSCMKENIILSIGRYNNRCKEQGLPIANQVIINIGDKCFCLNEKQETVKKIHSLFNKLKFLLSSTLTKSANNRQQKNNNLLIKNWKTVIQYKHST